MKEPSELDLNIMKDLLSHDILRTTGTMISVHTPTSVDPRDPPRYIQTQPQNLLPLKHHRPDGLSSRQKQLRRVGIEQRQEASLATQNQVMQASAPAGYALVDAVAEELPYIDKSHIGTVVFDELEKAWWINDQKKRFNHTIKQSIKLLTKGFSQPADIISQGETDHEKDNLHTHAELPDTEPAP